MGTEYILELKHISKSFPGVKALDDVTLCVRPGTVHSLMGENGAGKSTLMKCLFGIYSFDEGEIILDGKNIKFSSPSEALQNHVSMVHQELNQVLNQTVMENMWLGRFPMKHGLVNDQKMYEDTKAIFDDLDIQVNPKVKIGTLKVSQKQMIEIAKAVSYNSKVIVMDEPTSSLTEKEVEHLFKIIEKLKKKNTSIIYISHKMEEILRISDDVTVMRDGRWIDTKPASELTIDKIIKMMVGRELKDRYPEKKAKIGDVLMEVKDLGTLNPGFEGVNFQLHKGEILGIAGLVGSKRTEILETLFGIRMKGKGQILVKGKEVQNRSPKEAMANGFAMLTEERRSDGIFGGLSVGFNMTISNLPKYQKTGLLNGEKMKADITKMINAMKVKTPSMKSKIANLSGGNQQKVILGRWLLTDPDILLLDEPTRGIDVGAKFEIYQLINQLAEQGKGIIVVSSEMPELFGISDRILVMSNGHQSAIFDSKEVGQVDVMQAAADLSDLSIRTQEGILVKNSKNISIKELIAEKAIYLVFIILLVAIVVVEPRFLSFNNFKNIFAQSSTKIIIALAAGMVLVVQGVDLSTGRMIGLAAVIFASLVQNPDYAYRMYPNLKELPLIVPLLLVLAICLVLGGISGVLVAVFKVPPFIATLGMQLILYGASSIYFDRPPYGAQPIGGIDSKVTQIAIGSIGIGDFQIPYLIIIAAAVCVVMWIVWNKTKFGKYMFAVGGNPEAAKVSGVNVIKTQIMVYAIAGMMYAFAAALEVGRIGSASNTTGNGYEMDAVAACVIGGVSLSGGVGSVGGIVIGVLMFTVINYGLAFIGVNMYWQYIVKGLIILLAVIIDMRKYAKRK